MDMESLTVRLRASMYNNNNMAALLVKRLTSTSLLPKRASEHAAGYDLYADTDFVVLAQGQKLIPTGIAINIPSGHYGRIAPRSGLARYGIGVNAGVLDRDFSGEVKVFLMNYSDDSYRGQAGHRIAQLIIESNSTPPVLEVAELPASVRGDSGFGSTGV